MDNKKNEKRCDVCHSYYCCVRNHVNAELTPNQARNLAEAELEFSTLSNGRAQMLARAVLRYIDKEQK
jgi:hypothetical protein